MRVSYGAALSGGPLVWRLQLARNGLGLGVAGGAASARVSCLFGVNGWREWLALYLLLCLD